MSPTTPLTVTLVPTHNFPLKLKEEAVRGGHLDTCKILLSHGAVPNPDPSEQDDAIIGTLDHLLKSSLYRPKISKLLVESFKI